ncbi:hypothetical protein TNCV_3667751 [Trichonephila clavipes]|nr:hypothetical protein TNCV_3667751 [Trichonephila clavipes]
MESYLPEEILITSESHRRKKEASDGQYSLRNTLNFLNQEAFGEQVVYIARSGDDLKKRLQWLLVTFIELIPEKDGLTRTVRLKTQYSMLIHPIQVVISLEINGMSIFHHVIRRTIRINLGTLLFSSCYTAPQKKVNARSLTSRLVENFLNLKQSSVWRGQGPLLILIRLSVLGIHLDDVLLQD